MEVPRATSMQTGKRSVEYFGENRNSQQQNSGHPEQIQDEEFNKMIAQNHIVDDFAPVIDNQINHFVEEHAIPQPPQPPNPQQVPERIPPQPPSKPQQSYTNEFQKYPSATNPQPQFQKQKYYIMDMFWLINEKVCVAGQTVDEGEASFVIISFNMDFGNLRICLYDHPNGAVQGTSVFQQSLKTLVIGTIYPASCFKLMNIQEGEITCMEQLITNTGEQWQKERPQCRFNKINNDDDDSITLVILDPKTNKSHYFRFAGWQKESLLHACKFAYTEGFKLHGNNIIGNR